MLLLLANRTDMPPPERFCRLTLCTRSRVEDCRYHQTDRRVGGQIFAKKRGEGEDSGCCNEIGSKMTANTRVPEKIDSCRNGGSGSGGGAVRGRHQKTHPSHAGHSSRFMMCCRERRSWFFAGRWTTPVGAVRGPLDVETKNKPAKILFFV